MSQSVSFRITRTAEDVAQTLNALSHRLVKLEQRLETLELEMRHQRSQSETMPADELQRLDDVDQLLLDCQELLSSSEPEGNSEPESSDEAAVAESPAFESGDADLQEAA